MVGLYVDECVHGRVMCLGGLIVEGPRVRPLVLAFQRLKERSGYPNPLPLKWSLGQNDPDEVRAKEALKRKLGAGWLNEIRGRVLRFLSRRDVLLVAVVLEAVQGGNSDPIIYYERGIRFLLQRLCFIIKERKSKRNYVVLDSPPRDKARRAYKVYQDAYWAGFTFPNRVLAPLCLSCADCLYCSSSKFGPILQLADFWSGLVGTWAKKCLDEPRALPYYETLIRMMLPRIYGRELGKFGYGLVFLPKTGKLKSRAYASFLRCSS